MILLIDNYDSFSYNLYQCAGALNPDIKVVLNDKITIPEIHALNPSHIVLSPGPGRPADAGVCEDVIREFASSIPILGVCLGHQAICEVFGAEVTYAKRLMHGEASQIKLDLRCPLFAGLPPEISAARYHSLAARAPTVPPELLICAETSDGEVMAVYHKEHPLFGVQFHPESILTPQGGIIIKNFFDMRASSKAKERAC